MMRMEFIQWRVNTYSQKAEKNEDHKIIYTSHHSNRFVSCINFKVSFVIFLFSVKSNSSTPYNNVRKVKGATEDITFWSMILGLLNKGHPKKKWNSSSFTNPHEQAEDSTMCIDWRWPFRLLHRILSLAIITCSCLVPMRNKGFSFILAPNASLNLS